MIWSDDCLLTDKQHKACDLIGRGHPLDHVSNRLNIPVFELEYYKACEWDARRLRRPLWSRELTPDLTETIYKTNNLANLERRLCDTFNVHPT